MSDGTSSVKFVTVDRGWQGQEVGVDRSSNAWTNQESVRCRSALMVGRPRWRDDQQHRRLRSRCSCLLLRSSVRAIDDRRSGQRTQGSRPDQGYGHMGRACHTPSDHHPRQGRCCPPRRRPRRLAVATQGNGGISIHNSTGVAVANNSPNASQSITVTTSVVDQVLNLATALRAMIPVLQLEPAQEASTHGLVAAAAIGARERVKPRQGQATRQRRSQHRR